MAKSKNPTEKVHSASQAETIDQAAPIEKNSKNKKSKKRSKKESAKDESQPEAQAQPTSEIQNSQPAKKVKKKEKLKVQANGENIVSSVTAPERLNPPRDLEATSEFFKVSTKLYLTLAPCYVDDLNTGINEFLNSYLMRYLDSVRGIVLSHNETKLLQDNGVILYDSPHIHFWISTKFLVWRPTIGSHLSGTVQLQSVDHISLLLHGTFNAVILATDIPGSLYEWVETSDENEGEWVNSATKQPLADNGVLKFYVKSLSTPQDALTVNGTLTPIQK